MALLLAQAHPSYTSIYTVCCGCGCLQKLFRSYRGQAGKLLDLVRASITFDTIDDVLW